MLGEVAVDAEDGAVRVEMEAFAVGGFGGFIAEEEEGGAGFFAAEGVHGGGEGGGGDGAIQVEAEVCCGSGRVGDAVGCVGGDAGGVGEAGVGEGPSEEVGVGGGARVEFGCVVLNWRGYPRQAGGYIGRSCGEGGHG